MGYGITTSNIKYSANNAGESAYSTENVTPGGYNVNERNPQWILKEGYWDDSGIWIDNETWNDG